MTENLGHNKFQVQIAELEIKLEETKEQLSLKEVDFENSKNEIIELKKTIEEREHQISDLEKTVENLNNEQQSKEKIFECKLGELKNTICNLENEKKDLNKKIEEQDRQITESESKKGDHHQILSQVDDLKVKLQNSNDRLGEVESLLDEKMKELQVSENVVKSHAREIQTLKEEIQSKELLYEEVIAFRQQREREQQQREEEQRRYELQFQTKRVSRQELRQLRR